MFNHTTHPTYESAARSRQRSWQGPHGVKMASTIAGTNGPTNLISVKSAHIGESTCPLPVAGRGQRRFHAVSLLRWIGQTRTVNASSPVPKGQMGYLQIFAANSRRNLASMMRTCASCAPEVHRSGGWTLADSPERRRRYPARLLLASGRLLQVWGGSCRIGNTSQVGTRGCSRLEIEK